MPRPLFGRDMSRPYGAAKDEVIDMKVAPPYRFPLMLAIALHLVVIAFLFVQIAMPSRAYVAQRSVKIVNAVAVNQQQVDNEIKQLRAEKQRKRAQALAAVRRLQQQAREAAQKRRKEQLRLAQLKIERVKAEQERRATEKRLVLEKARARAKAIVDAKQKSAEKAKKEAAHAKVLAHAKALAAAKQKAAKAKTLAEKQRKLAMEKMMQEQLASEKKAEIAQAKAQAIQGVVDKYKALILQAIAQRWIVPNNVDKNLSSLLLIQLAPGGVVLDVKVIRSSGDSVLDRSARVAVLKASPLPVPKDPAAFDRFRQLRLTVRPEDVL